MSNLFFNDDPGTIATNDTGGLFDGAEGIFNDLIGGVADIFKSRDARKLQEKQIDTIAALRSTPAFGGNSAVGSSSFSGSSGGGGFSGFQLMSLGLAAVGVLVAVMALRK